MDNIIKELLWFFVQNVEQKILTTHHIIRNVGKEIRIHKSENVNVQNLNKEGIRFEKEEIMKTH